MGGAALFVAVVAHGVFFDGLEPTFGVPRVEMIRLLAGP